MIQKIKMASLIHLGILVLIGECLMLASKPRMEPFYFLAGVLCIPVFGTLRGVSRAVNLHIKNN